MTDYKATTQQWAEVEEWVEGSECSWDHCLVELRDRVDTLEHALQQTRVDYLRLSNAVANSCPDRNKFFADLIPDEDSGHSNGSDHIREVKKMVPDSTNYPESPDTWLGDQLAKALNREYLDSAHDNVIIAMREISNWLRGKCLTYTQHELVDLLTAEMYK